MLRLQLILLTCILWVCLLRNTQVVHGSDMLPLMTKCWTKNSELHDEITSLNVKLAKAHSKMSNLEEKVQQCTQDSQLGSRKHPANSCLEIANDRGGKAKSGAYFISSAGHVHEVYCSMHSLGTCGGTGWTTLMMIDGRKPTFHYNSPLWTNHRLYGVSSGKRGLHYQETKLHTFSGMPFTSLCLVFRSLDNLQLSYVPILQSAPSLYSLVSNNTLYTRTTAGRQQWLSSINRAALQPNCNKEGFNPKDGAGSTLRAARIGILGNNENHCISADSVIGVGISQEFSTWTGINLPKMSAGFYSRNDTSGSRRVGGAFVYVMAE